MKKYGLLARAVNNLVGLAHQKQNQHYKNKPSSSLDTTSSRIAFGY